MAAFLEDSEFIADLEALVQGGRTLVVDSPGELDALIRLCRESNTLGLGHVYDWLPRFNEWLDWVGIEDTRRRNVEFEGDDTIWKHPDNLTATEGLEVSLRWAREIWAEAPDAEGLRFLVSVGSDGDLLYEGQTPGLFLYQGSVNAVVTPFLDAGTFSLKLGAFAVGMCVAVAFLPNIQSEKLVIELRDHAREKAKFPSLPALDEVNSHDLQGKRGLIVLLHGLFSTDVATFDGFIDAFRQCPAWDYMEYHDLQSKWRALRDEPPYASTPSEGGFQNAFLAATTEDYLIVGWPHDTLTAIDINAGKLSTLLVNLDPEAPVIFVCHSRGGLLARKAAQMLSSRHASDWNDRIALCVTFGTPHEGADIADHPLRLVAAYLMVMSGTGTLLSVARVLAIYRSRKQFAGIEDLRPDSQFLTKLTAEEIHTAPGGRTRALKIHAVGGAYRGRKPFPQVFVSALLGTRDHDLVVRRRSSVPDTFADCTITDCGHGDYFQERQTTSADFLTIIRKIRDVLGVEDAMLNRADAHPNW